MYYNYGPASPAVFFTWYSSYTHTPTLVYPSFPPTQSKVYGSFALLLPSLDSHDFFTSITTYWPRVGQAFTAFYYRTIRSRFDDHLKSRKPKKKSEESFIHIYPRQRRHTAVDGQSHSQIALPLWPIYFMTFPIISLSLSFSHTTPKYVR